MTNFNLLLEMSLYLSTFKTSDLCLPSTSFYRIKQNYGFNRVIKYHQSYFQVYMANNKNIFNEYKYSPNTVSPILRVEVTSSALVGLNDFWIVLTFI